MITKKNTLKLLIIEAAWQDDLNIHEITERIREERPKKYTYGEVKRGIWNLINKGILKVDSKWRVTVLI